MSLAGAVAHPVKSHVDGFGASLLHIVVGDAKCALIFYLDWGRRLWVAHFFGGNPDGLGISEGLVQASQFSICGLFHYIVNDVIEEVDCTVDCRRGIF